MNKFYVILALGNYSQFVFLLPRISGKLLFWLALVAVASIQCDENVQDGSSNDMTREEIAALTRDGNYRMNPDGLLQGFLAAWPVVLFVLAGKIDK